MQYKFQKHHSFKGRKKDRFALQRMVNAGKKLIAFSMLAAVGFMVYPWELHEEFNAWKKELPVKMGVSISEINIEGLERVSHEDIAHIIDFNVGDNLYELDLNSVRTKLEEYPWIASATVERVLPSSIRITVQEERPKAVYIKGNERFFINDNGKIIEKILDPNVGESYIYVSGDGANQSYSDILDQVYECENIYQRIEGLVKVGQKRWDLKIKNNITIKLPQENIIAALTKFSKLMDDNLEYFNGGSIIDLRFMPEKMYIK